MPTRREAFIFALRDAIRDEIRDEKRNELEDTGQRPRTDSDTLRIINTPKLSPPRTRPRSNPPPETPPTLTVPSLRKRERRETGTQHQNRRTYTRTRLGWPDLANNMHLQNPHQQTQQAPNLPETGSEDLDHPRVTKRVLGFSDLASNISLQGPRQQAQQAPNLPESDTEDQIHPIFRRFLESQGLHCLLTANNMHSQDPHQQAQQPPSLPEYTAEDDNRHRFRLYLERHGVQNRYPANNMHPQDPPQEAQQPPSLPDARRAKVPTKAEAYALRNPSADIPDSENTAIWIENLPPNCSYAKLLSAIQDCGKIYACVINTPTDIHFTSAAKVIFFDVEGRSRLQSLAEHNLFLVDNYIPDIRLHRIKTPAQEPGPQSRVLVISGPPSIVNQHTIFGLFNQVCIFDIECIETAPYRPEIDQGIITMEFRFASYRAQAERAILCIWEARDKMMANGSKVNQGIWTQVTARFGWDPCDREPRQTPVRPRLTRYDPAVNNAPTRDPAYYVPVLPAPTLGGPFRDAPTPPLLVSNTHACAPEKRPRSLYPNNYVPSPLLVSNTHACAPEKRPPSLYPPNYVPSPLLVSNTHACAPEKRPPSLYWVPTRPIPADHSPPPYAPRKVARES
ncbi:hypothetical protein GGR57DRAFT_518980 [Xylariaceae sp. FL1272]|nr:hypothetical protein GGR57DRAFT_518980 [Xylariaceae sp. FL1272]